MSQTEALRRTGRPRSALLPLLAGIAAAVLVAGAGLAFGLTRPAQFRATATLVVLPSRSIPADQAASYYDVLSRGQVVTTFAEILQLRVAASSGGDSVQVAPVPDTAVIQVAATASTAAAAERRANAGFGTAQRYFSALSSPYDVSVVSDATHSAQRVGTSPALLLAVVGVTSIIAGVGVTAAVRRLQWLPSPSAPTGPEARSRFRGRQGEELPGGPAA